jgi:hypothetical protein
MLSALEFVLKERNFDQEVLISMVLLGLAKEKSLHHLHKHTGMEF